MVRISLLFRFRQLSVRDKLITKYIFLNRNSVILQLKLSVSQKEKIRFFYIVIAKKRNCTNGALIAEYIC